MPPERAAGSTPGVVAVVTPEGDAHAVADGVAFPNGTAVTADASALVVAESFASRLGAWDVEAEADGDPVEPTGVGARPRRYPRHLRRRRRRRWCATQRGCLRLREGGEVARTIPFGLLGFSCALGGPEGRTLFGVANEWSGYENIGKGPRTGRVHAVDVDVPGLARSVTRSAPLECDSRTP